MVVFVVSFKLKLTSVCYLIENKLMFIFPINMGLNADF
ncbi:hypothetical protein HDE70_001030 [Pedobacter cryoconitis]|nr:hypothetical protein [Pedobacter cryoconitis]